MKALLYKEFRLAMHPICYVFIFVFPAMILIPNYPIAIGFIYILSCYPILFLGANKGQQSNDLLFSTLLPIRKKDIVLARIITVSIIQFVFIILTTAYYPLASLIKNSIVSSGGPANSAGIGLEGYVSVLGIVMIGFALADLTYFCIYYKNGKSIVMSTLLTIFGFILYISIFTIAMPYIPFCQGYVDFLCNSGLGPQFLILGIGLVVYIVLHFVVYKVASKELEQVDF